jgi:hypothetical protein
MARTERRQIEDRVLAREQQLDPADQSTAAEQQPRWSLAAPDAVVSRAAHRATAAASRVLRVQAGRIGGRAASE